MALCSTLLPSFSQIARLKQKGSLVSLKQTKILSQNSLIFNQQNLLDDNLNKILKLGTEDLSLQMNQRAAERDLSKKKHTEKLN